MLENSCPQFAHDFPDLALKVQHPSISGKPGQMVSQHNLEWDIWVITAKSH